MQDQPNVAASTTPGDGGDITASAEAATTSLASRSTVAGPAVVEPLPPDDSPAAAGSDESFQDALFDFELSGLDPKKPPASASTPAAS